MSARHLAGLVALGVAAALFGCASPMFGLGVSLLLTLPVCVGMIGWALIADVRDAKAARR